ncbi:MAG: hypothetical protein MUC50_06730 [Myxococcota bacterium]|nr:hypothetical protein [Myxococcota bacterium]
MNFDQATVEIRPRGIPEVLDLAVQLYRVHFGLLWALQLVWGLPACLAAALCIALGGSIWLGMLVFYLLLPLASGAVILAASRLVFGIELTLGRATSLFRPVALPHLGTRLLHRLIWLPLLPLVLGQSLRLSWAFTPMVQLLERLKGAELKLRRAALYRRAGGTSLGLDMSALLLVLCLVFALAFTVDFVFSDFFALWRTGGFFEGEDVAGSPLLLGLWMLIGLTCAPIFDLAWFLLYLDARTRKEGWDIELGMRSARERLIAADPKGAA